MYALGSTKFSVGVSFVVLLLVLGTRGQTCDPMSPSCPRNAVCEEIMSGMFRCVCAPGFYDFPPNRVIERDGCLGECDRLGPTQQCPGNTECFEALNGFGECRCPPGTSGEPDCFPDDGSSVTESPGGGFDTSSGLMLAALIILPLLILLPTFIASSTSMDGESSGSGFGRNSMRNRNSMMN